MDRNERRSTHYVHRGVGLLPCYCSATSDHPIGSEAPPPPAEQASGVKWCDAFDRDVAEWGNHYLASRLAEASRQLRALSQRPVVDEATLRQSLHAMKRCAQESGAKAWEPWIDILQRALAPQQPTTGERE